MTPAGSLVDGELVVALVEHGGRHRRVNGDAVAKAPEGAGPVRDQQVVQRLLQRPQLRARRKRAGVHLDAPERVEQIDAGQRLAALLELRARRVTLREED